ncbi:MULTISPECIES: hypothetical protein [unclassified Thalassospira]|uniref:head-tail connector protein n=1 Tax=unclassified Thalassospira TaxID=2648997 RepID=UPI0007A61439|nr:MULTISPECIES: hypothetical protein [unclassified Thalassospira]KZC99697.1 hypothetical protein AUQ41_08445 [Thalassospira sp. MCCC 1A02898]ONH85377.1 hypothetical protein TH47_05900 [Thalassospira sp. MCCC 1A02803]
MDVSLKTAPGERIVTLDQAKAQLRVPAAFADEDDYIESLVLGAESYIDGRDGILGRALVSQTWVGTLDGAFPSEITLPLPPLQTVSSIKYIDADGVEQTLDSAEYQVINNVEPGLIVPAFGKTWPTVRVQRQAITVEFVAGYGTAAELPEKVRQMVLFLVGHWYINRVPINVGNIVNDIPETFMSLFNATRKWGF